MIVDQEFGLHKPDESVFCSVDIIHFDTYLGCLAFVKVTDIHDGQLRPDQFGEGGSFSRLEQITTRIYAEENPDDSKTEKLREILERVVRLKRQIGLGRRVAAVPSEGVRILAKPMLVIGNCSDEDVTEILNGQGEWETLMEGLEERTAGLIPCTGDDGELSLRPGPQNRLFDRRLA